MLEAHLLGSFQIKRDGLAVELPSRPAQALLAYLLLNPGRPVRREKLAGLLWPEADEANARSSLRHALWRIRKALEVGGGPVYIEADDLGISLRLQPGDWLDVAVLEGPLSEPAQLDDLLRQAQVYGGELLPGFYEDWAALERTRLQAVYEDRLRRLTVELLRQGRWSEAAGWCEQWIALGGAPEPAFRFLMLASAGQGNQAGVSAAYQRCREALDQNLGVKPSQQSRQIYERLLLDEPAETVLGLSHPPSAAPRPAGHESPAQVPSRKSPGTRHNLSLQLSSFVGREQEIEEVIRYLSSERLVTLVGAGGCGKTRLALQAASRLLESFPDGVWMVELAQLSDPSLIALTAARALGLSDLGERTPAEILLDFLRSKRLLLVLDNCEHLIDSCAYLVETLVGTCLDLRLLATSREALCIPGEKVFYVPSLSIPEASESLTGEQAQCYEALRLFQERAAASLPGFQITDDNVASLAQVCRRLDGIPLAIELAAARVKVLSVEQIAARLDDCFHLLTGGSRTALPRHQTLRAAIDWSYNLLSNEQERILLRRLSVFPGSWTLEAAEAICSGDGLAPGEVLEALAGLVSKSMVTATHTSGWGVRYTQLEMLRQYGHEKLQQAREEADCLERHLDYFLRFAEAGDRRLHGSESLEWMRSMDMEYSNLRLALEWCFDSGQAREDGLRLANALFEFWNRVSNYHELRYWGEIALEQSRDLQGKPARARILCGYGAFLLSTLGKWDEGRRLVEESLETWRSLDDSYRSDAARALVWLGYMPHWHNEAQTGATCLQEAIDIFREISDHWWLGYALTIFSELKFKGGDVQAASKMAEEGASAFLHNGDRYGAAINWLYQGEFIMLQGDYLPSRPFFERARGIFLEYGCKVFASRALNQLGEVARFLNEYEKARALYLESLSIRQEIGAGPQLLFSPAINLGFTCLYLGDDQQAAFYFQQAINASRQLENKRTIIFSLVGCAALATARGNVEEAARLYGAADMLHQNFLGEPLVNLYAEPVDRRELEHYQALCLAQLGEERFDAAWQAGRALTLEQALAEAEATAR